MGSIDLATLIFPQSTDETRIDIVARQHLYNVGLDYHHGTGHGIGVYLGVHESEIADFFKNTINTFFSVNNRTNQFDYITISVLNWTIESCSHSIRFSIL